MPESDHSVVPQVMPKTKRIPKKKQKSDMVLMRTRFSGPLPLPSHLDQYNHIVPGAGERILKMAENQSQHRQECEKREIKDNSRNSLLGLLFGFSICLLVIGSGVYLIVVGKTTEGLIGLLVPMATLVTAFIWGKDSKKK